MNKTFRPGILLMVAALAIGCGSPAKTGSTSTAAPAAAATSAGAGGADLKGLSEAMAKATSFEITTKTSGVESTISVICPDKVHSVTKTGAVTAETVQIGADMWIKAGGMWMRSPVAATGMNVCGAGSVHAPKVDLSSTAAWTKGGTETVDGESCTDYTFAGAGQTVSICIGNDNLVRKYAAAGTEVTYTKWNKVEPFAPPK